MWRRVQCLRCAMIMLIAITLYVLTRGLPVVDGLDRTGQSVLGVALGGMLLWVSEIVPSGVTALAVLVLLGTIRGCQPPMTEAVNGKRHAHGSRADGHTRPSVVHP